MTGCANDGAGDPAGAGEADATTSASDDDGSSGTDGDDGSDDGSAPAVVGSCEYVSPFTQGAECRDYLGEGWSEDDVVADCEGLGGATALGQACAVEGMLGRCTIEQAADRVLEVVAYGDDAGACATQQLGCETFGGGTWDPAPLCQGDPGGSDGNVFIQPTLECRDPLPGEPPGAGPNGQVCTWQMISGCTEEGRHFEDYASCDVVRTQRPYYPSPPAEGWDQEDPRLDDPVYVEELAWVRSQIEASACVCCHSETAPNGPSNWYIEQPGNFINGLFDSGLAMGSRWLDSSAFGAYAPQDNNGFERETSGFPSTDPQRMRDFFVAELTHRGLSEADFAGMEDFGGPLYDQLVYEPSACEDGEGVRRDGSIVWDGAGARYVYVLDAGSANPTVPPNLDLPPGTRWRVDVPADGDPIESGSIAYGELPAGTTQRFPEQGAPPALTPGQTYYLYVTRDVALPITRCLFTY
ncbi:MAG: hypothetical protein H6712_19860 [Myxococcales bacterium]|nr:hypothetical protein [Myxococcales bacterium]MCB9716132.1 hypothetical protein [Myxococcales bacterium]